MLLPYFAGTQWAFGLGTLGAMLAALCESGTEMTGQRLLRLVGGWSRGVAEMTFANALVLLPARVRAPFRAAADRLALLRSATFAPFLPARIRYFSALPTQNA